MQLTEVTKIGRIVSSLHPSVGRWMERAMEREGEGKLRDWGRNLFGDRLTSPAFVLPAVQNSSQRPEASAGFSPNPDHMEGMNLKLMVTGNS
jgi:hypothetical protein